MDLTTRCPKCDTVFQANLTDLQLRKGYIRCVQCSHIFDGYAEVVADTSKDPYFEEHPEDSSNSAHVDQNEPIVSFDDSLPDDDKHSFSINLSSDNKPAQSEPFIIAPNMDRISADNSRFNYDELESSSSFRGVLSWFLLILLLLLLALQGAYIYRAQIAQNLPFTRVVLEKYCGVLNCSVPYLRNIDNLVITKSALKVISPKLTDQANNSDHESDSNEQAPATENNSGIRNYELQFNLRNLADQPQEWPAIVLDLKDSSGQVQVRRNIAPKDYLLDTKKPFAARSEVFIRLPLQLNSDASINGFQLDLFYP